jgi:hypothetical protein
VDKNQTRPTLQGKTRDRPCECQRQRHERRREYVPSEASADRGDPLEQSRNRSFDGTFDGGSDEKIQAVFYSMWVADLR